ncbi:MAG: threonine-phosphate decarboxylase CobD [Eubacterium sp.]|nr:threonine-phosphate decarboxylase CobD [Eubacterium sp.]
MTELKQIHGGDVYRHPGVLDFSSNMNPLGPPESVKKAAKESIDHIQDYPDVAKEKLIAALSDYEQVPSDYIVCGNGAAEVIYMLAWALRPRKALLAVPTFAEYELALKTAGCDTARFFLDPEKDFRVDEAFLASINASYDLVVLCNPNNPTGLTIDPVLLKKILDKCRENDIYLLVDECFQDFLDQDRSPSLKPYLASCPGLFLLKAFTKRYAMAGLRLGYGLSSDSELLSRMAEAVQPWNVSIPAQAAGTAALNETDYVKKAQEIIRTERDFLKEELRKKGFKVWDSEANYIFFQGPEGLVEKALEKNILIRSCANYPGLDETYYRVAVKTHEQNQKLLEAL